MTRSREERTKSFMGNVTIVLFAQLIVKILGLVYRMVITNIGGFGDIGLGFYNTGFQVYTVLLAVSSIGIPNAIAKMVSERVALDDFKGAHKVFKSALLLFAIIGAVCSGLLYFGADIIAKHIVNMNGAQYVMRALAPSIFFVCVSSVIRGYFQGLNNMNATSNSQMLEQLFKCALTIVFVMLTVGAMPKIMQIITNLTLLYNKDLATSTPPEIMASWANTATSLATLISFAYLIWFYYRKKASIKKSLLDSKTIKASEPTLKLMKSILMLSIPISLASIIAAVNRVIDTATITRGIEVAFAGGIPAYGNNPQILSPTIAQLNEYAVILSGRLSKSDTIINMPLALNVAFATVLVPSISGAVAKGDLDEASNKISYSFLISTLLILPCVSGIIFLAGPIYQIIYPNAQLGADLLALMAISLIFSALTQTMSGALQGLGKVFVPAIGLLVGCVFKVVLNILLIQETSINIYGAAISTIICQIVAFIISYVVLSRYLKMNIRINKHIVKPIIACLVMGVMAFVTHKTALLVLGTGYINNLISTLISICVAVIVYIIMLLVLKILSADDIKMLPYGNKIYSLLKKLKIYKEG